MPQRRLLYLDASHLVAYRWQGGTLRDEGRFPAGDEGVAAFAEYLGQHARSLFYLLADVAEEGFQLESLPYTHGADRKALLARKLGQYFYGSPLATAIPLGRERSGRRDEKILFTALTRPQLFEPWLGALREVQAQLAGVYSLPLLGAALLAKIPPVHERCLLVTLTTAGIRQSFFENGQIHFSRLTPFVASNVAYTAAACAAETAKIHQYLLGQRLIARGVELRVIVLAHPAQAGAFTDACRGTEELQFQVVDLAALGHAAGLKTLPQDSRSELLFLHLLARKPPREQFAQAPDRRFFRLWQARFAMTGAGAVALAGCLLVAGKQFYELSQLRGLTAQTRAQAEADAQRYAAIQQTFPPMPTSTDNLRAVINRYDELEKRSAPIEPLYLAVSRGLQDAPGVDIDRIDWLLSANPDEGAQGQDAGRGAAPATDRAAGGAMHMIAVIHATLPLAMVSDQRGQLEAIDGFADVLRRDAALKVSILRRPFDIESGKSLKGGGDSAVSLAQPKFVLHLSRKL